MFAKEIYFISVFAISNIHHSIEWGVGKEQGERGRVRGGREKGRGKREEKKRYPDQGSEREKNKYLDLELQLAGWIRIRNTVRINFKASSFGLCAGGLAEPQGFGSFLQNLFRPVANIFSPLRQIYFIYCICLLYMHWQHTPWPFCHPRFAILQSSPPYYKGEKKFAAVVIMHFITVEH